MTEAYGPDGRGGPHVFVADLEHPCIDDHDRHHLSKVLRLRPGDPCTLGDGHGGWRAARFGVEVEVTGDVIHVPRPAPEITVGFALIKGSRPELIVQKLTELGIDRIAAFESARSVVRWDNDKRRDQRDRWQRVAREAAMQSRQVWLPAVEPIGELADLCSRPGAHLADLGATPIGASVSTVLVGPEGGWTDDERGDLPVVGLGPHVLRAETAALAAGVRLATQREK